MAETNPILNPVTGRQWDLNSLIEKLLELQESLLHIQEKNISLTAQCRELERVARDSDDIKAELANQGQLLADKSRENKQLHQELSRMSASLDARVQEAKDLKEVITDVQSQLKTCQSERDRLATMLLEAEDALRQVRRSDSTEPAQPYAARETQGQPQQSGWFKFPKGRQS